MSESWVLRRREMLRIGKIVVLLLVVPSATLSAGGLSEQIYQDTRQVLGPFLDAPLRSLEEFSEITSKKGAPYFFAPWSASLAVADFGGSVLTRFFCNATLIAPTWALTVANCVASGTQEPSFELRYGTDNIEKTNSVGVEEIFIHDAYQPSSEDQPGGTAQIALLRLAEPVKTRAFASLPLGPYDPSLLGAEARVTGWGSISEGGDPTEQLVQLDTLVLERDTCSSPTFYGAAFNNFHELCATSTVEGTDACQGFSGSALIAERRGPPEVIGLVNWGDGCGRPNKPTVYVDTWAYRDWISSTIEKNS